MAISNPMGKAPSGASTSEAVTKLDIQPGDSSSGFQEPVPCHSDDDPEMREKRRELERLQLDNQIKKQKAIASGKLSLDKIY